MIAASVKDSEPVLKLLISKDADVNAKSKFTEAEGTQRLTDHS